MNVIFTLILSISTFILIFTSPNTIINSIMHGGEKALDLSLKLISVYAVWLGIFEILKRTGLTKKLAKLLKPANKKLFGKISDEANDFIALNLSTNILGINGVATPLGINAIKELEKSDNEFAIAMFFVLNATSVQLLPSSVIALRASMQSVAPGNIIIPTLISTTISTVVGVILVKIFIKKPKK